MIALAYKKTVNTAWLAGLASAVIMPDIMFGLLLELLHLALECAHLGFELFESALDHAVEHVFHTGTKETQIIVFYLMMTMGLVAFCLLWHKFTKFVRALKSSVQFLLLANKNRFLDYWAESAHNKFKLIAGVNVALTIIYFVGF